MRMLHSRSRRQLGYDAPVVYPDARRFGADVVDGSLFEGAAGDYREEFLYAVEIARAQHDPATDWDGFRDTLWEYLARVFGVDLTEADVPGGMLLDEEVTAIPRPDGPAA